MIVREGDGTLKLNREEKALFKKAMRKIAGELAKKILKGSVRGLDVPIFIFRPPSYLQT